MNTPAMRKFRRLVLASSALLPASLLTAQVTWDGGGANGNFNNAANWAGDPTITTAAANYVFTGNINTNVTISDANSYAATSITFDANAGAFVIGPNGQLTTPTNHQTSYRFTSVSTITQNSSANQVINATVQNSSATAASPQNGPLLITGSGTGSLTLNSLRQVGVVTIARNVTFNAGFANGGGTSNIRTYNIGGNAALAGNNTFNGTATATFNSNPFADLVAADVAASVTPDLQKINLGSTSEGVGVYNVGTAHDLTANVEVFNSTGNSGFSGNAALNVTGGLSFTANTSFVRKIAVSNTAGVTIQGATTLTNATGVARNINFDVTGTGKLTLAGVVGESGGAGKLLKNGTGTLTLANANTYTGGTDLLVGTLALTNTTGSATGSGAFTSSAGTTLIGTGSMNVSSIAINGAVNAGATGAGSVGNLSFTSSGATTFGSTSSIGLDVASASSFDTLTFNSNATLGGGLSFSFGSTLADGTYDFFLGSGATSGSLSSVSATGSYSGSFADVGGGLWSLAGSGLTFNSATGVLTVAAIPEPSAFAALAGLGALGLVTSRRRARR